MKYAEIVELLEKGFSPDQIMALAYGSAPEPAAAEVTEPVDPAPVETVEQNHQVETQFVEPEEPAWARKLNENIASMKRTIQAQNIAKDLSDGAPKQETAEDIMLGMIGHHDGGNHA